MPATVHRNKIWNSKEAWDLQGSIAHDQFRTSDRGPCSGRNTDKWSCLSEHPMAVPNRIKPASCFQLTNTHDDFASSWQLPIERNGRLLFKRRILSQSKRSSDPERSSPCCPPSHISDVTSSPGTTPLRQACSLQAHTVHLRLPAAVLLSTHSNAVLLFPLEPPHYAFVLL